MLTDTELTQCPDDVCNTPSKHVHTETIVML